jgi:hypothetical protein
MAPKGIADGAVGAAKSVNSWAFQQHDEEPETHATKALLSPRNSALLGAIFVHPPVSPAFQVFFSKPASRQCQHT